MINSEDLTNITAPQFDALEDSLHARINSTSDPEVQEAARNDLLAMARFLFKQGDEQ